MKSCLLLIFSVMTGIKASAEEKVCAQGWIQFTCKYPQENKNDQRVKTSIQTKRQTCKTDAWLNIDRFSHCLDRLNKGLRVAVKLIKRSDDGDYSCTFLLPSNGKHRKEIEIDDDIEKYPGLVIYTVPKAAKITITCDSERQKPKDISCISEDSLSSESSENPNGRFTLTPTAGGFNVSIRNVYLQDAGSYWGGIESADRTCRVSLTKVQLDVKSGSWLTAVTAATICVAVAVLVVILIFVYKRFECSNNSTDGEAPNKEAVYEEIQESSLKSGPGTSLKTVYITATFPTNPAAFMDYSTVNFQNRPGEVTGEVYSTVMDSSQHPSYSTVNHPSTVSKDRFHSPVKEQ